MFEMDKIAEIRILPSDKGTFPSESEFKNFIEYTMIKRGGYYYFPSSMMQCPRRTLVLFQYAGMIRAIGLLTDKGKEKRVDERGVEYEGYYKFDKETLFYLDNPISKEQLRIAYPDFGGFQQSKTKIPLSYLPKVFMLLGKHDKRIRVYNETEQVEEQRRKTVEKIEKEIESVAVPGVEKKVLIKARINQGVFRKSMIEKYKSKCCLCGITEPALLIASHIKPWAECLPEERLVPDNGLLLCPNHDKLFDRGYISFDESGYIIISEELSDTTCKEMGLCLQCVQYSGDMRKYMDYHRTKYFPE